MAAFEIIALSVGGAIAKALLRQYASDSWFELGKDMLEKLTDHGIKTVEQRNAEQRIDSIAARITRDLFSFFEREGSPLTSQQHAILATQLSLTLQQVNIDSALLLRYRRKPARLAEYLLSARSAANHDLSELETSFYQHALLLTISQPSSDYHPASGLRG